MIIKNIRKFGFIIVGVVFLVSGMLMAIFGYSINRSCLGVKMTLINLDWNPKTEPLYKYRIIIWLPLNSLFLLLLKSTSLVFMLLRNQKKLFESG